jgi:hypothetical protein
MPDLLAVLYLIGFAVIGGGAFALMTQSLRHSDQRTFQASPRRHPLRHPEAPQPGEEVLVVDFNRERLEQLFQQTP